MIHRKKWTPTEDRPRPKYSLIVAMLLFFIVLFLVFGFEVIWNGAGCWWVERKMPSVLTVESIEAVYGKPDKACDKSEQCTAFLKSFRYNSNLPDYAEYFTYTDQFPILPILVFFRDADKNIIGYAFGRN